MSVIGHSPLAGASGAAGGAGPLYVDDVFSTFLYEGTSSNQAISNGLDLSTEGGLVWLKARSANYDHWLFDTERGATKGLRITTDSEYTLSDYFSSFNSNGFTVGSNGSTNYSGIDFASWSFRKAPGFFDVVTYSGTGSVQNISHSLGSVPGMIMIHCRDGTHDWEVYHRATGATKSLHLNKTDAQATDSNVWNNTTPTSSVFTVGTSSNVNQNGHGYVAYVFAHDEQSFGTDSDESIIKCGSWNSSGGAATINLGFEPQLVMSKCASGTGAWLLFDGMRGMTVGGNDAYLIPNSNGIEDSSTNFIDPTPNGFTVSNMGSSQTFIYMAIRRPHKPPEAATEVFALDTLGGTSPNPPGFNAGFPVDMAFTIETASSNTKLNSRLTQGRRLFTNLTNVEDADSGAQFYYQDGWQTSTAVTTDYVSWMFRRAPGFFDVVTYTGNNATRNISHNLEAVPEIVICKSRDSSFSWTIYSSVTGADKRLRFDTIWEQTNDAWNDTAPTSSVFTLSNNANVNYPGVTFVAYLFATLDGISKIGSYTGTGNNINVDCGFAAGARLVIIKRTDSNPSAWYAWDTLRGIVSGNDPYKLLNSNAAQVTNTDYIDPLNAGFTVTSSAPAELNASGGTDLFIAIA